MFFILLNFFLAIVVDTFTRVQELVEESLVEMSFLDLRLMDDDEPFTAKEVVLRSKKGMEFEGLDKPHKAAKWLRYYATKLWEDGRYVLLWENPEEQKASQEKRE